MSIFRSVYMLYHCRMWCYARFLSGTNRCILTTRARIEGPNTGLPIRVLLPHNLPTAVLKLLQNTPLMITYIYDARSHLYQKSPFGCLNCDHSCCHLCLGGHQWWCCGPVEWSRVVLPQEHKISRLDVDGWAMPALAMLQLMEIVSRPPSSSSGVVVVVATWTIYSFECSSRQWWVVGWVVFQLGNVQGRDRNDVNHSEEHKGVFSIKNVQGGLGEV